MKLFRMLPCQEEGSEQKLRVLYFSREVSIFNDSGDFRVGICRKLEYMIGTMIRKFYIKNRETILYLVFGGMAFLMSVGIFALFDTVIGVNELVANMISWIITVMFAFFTNKTYVFQVRTESVRSFFTQMISFCTGRLVTLIIEELILGIFITILHFSDIPVKIIAQVIVIIMNYIISKWIVFSKKNEHR